MTSIWRKCTNVLTTADCLQKLQILNAWFPYSTSTTQVVWVVGKYLSSEFPLEILYSYYTYISDLYMTQYKRNGQ